MDTTDMRMKTATTYVHMNGTWYLRVPPAYAEYIGLKEPNGSKVERVEGEIQNEKNKHGQRYLSAWLAGT